LRFNTRGTTLAIKDTRVEADSRTPATMGKSAKERKDAKFKLKQPDRSGPDPSHQTLFDIAEQRGLLKPQPGDKFEEAEEDEEEPLVGRLGDSILWSMSLTMLHLTLDVLVSHQYAQEIEWPAILSRAAQAFPSTFQPFVHHHLLISYSHSYARLLFPSTSNPFDTPSEAFLSNTLHPPSVVVLHW
jgi:hypothetical protein